MRLVVPATTAWLSALLALATCHPGEPSRTPGSAGPPPAAPASSGLGVRGALPAWSAPRAPAVPVRVIHRSPAGSETDARAILVTFNQPMVSLGRVRSAREDPARFPILVSPGVTAEHRWVSADTLKLSLTKPLQNATRYRVRLLPGLRSVAGTALEKPVAWSFETPRPQVTEIVAVTAQRFQTALLHPQDRFRVSVSQRATAEALAKVLQVTAGGAAWPVRVTRDPKDPRALWIAPSKPWPRSAKVLLRVSEGLQGTEGPLPGNLGRTHEAIVLGPLTAQVLCDDRPIAPGRACWPMNGPAGTEGVTLAFSVPVTRRALLRHLRVTPPIPRLGARLGVVHDMGCSIPSEPKTVCAATWAITGDLAPATRYAVRIAAGMTDVWGQRLGRTVVTRFATRDFPPGLHLPEGGESFRERWHPFGWKAVNVREVDVAIHPYTGGALARFVSCLRRHKAWEDRCVTGPPTEERRFRFSGTKNALQSAILDLPPGLVALRFTSPQVRNAAGARVRFERQAIRTDLGLQARLTPYGLTAWVTSLRTGAAVPGVAVTVYDAGGKALAAGRTDARGLVRLPQGRRPWAGGDRGPPPVVVVAERGPDLAYATPGGKLGGAKDLGRKGVEERPPDDSLDSENPWPGRGPRLVGHVSTERGIYRPGDEIFVHGAVRRYRGWRGEPAAGLPVTLRLVGPFGNVLGEARARTSAHGVFLGRLELPRQARLGYGVVRLTVGKQWLSTRYFRVAEYRAAEFAAQVTVSPRAVLADDVLNASLSGRFRFGGAMGGAGYRARLWRRPVNRTWKRWPDYSAGSNELPAEKEAWLRREGTLDPAGRARVSVNLRGQGKTLAAWPLEQHVEVEVWSASRQTMVARDSVRQLPGRRLVAVRVLAARPGRLRHHLRVLDAAGRPHAAAEVRAQLLPHVEQGWQTTVRWDRPLWSGRVPVGVGGETLTVPWPKGYERSYAFLLLSVTDPEGREARTGLTVSRPTPFYVLTQQAERENGKPREELTVRLDRKEYLPGQQAVVTITRGAAVRSAVLFVERERVFQCHALSFDAQGRARVTLPVERAWASEVAVRAVGIRAGPALRSAAGPLVTASTSLKLADAPFALQVALRTDRPVYRPGQRVTVSLRVTDGLGRERPAEVVLMAVDEAVLSLTRFSLPDPYEALAYTPSQGIRVEDVRQFLAKLPAVTRHFDHAAERFSRDSEVSLEAEDTLGALRGHTYGMGSLGLGGWGDPQDRPRRSFRTTAWHGSVVTDPSGRAKATFTLPDNVTSYGLMAFAVDKDRSAGTGRARFRVELPLLALPALPRFLREGDAAQAGVLLYRAAASAGPVEVTAGVRGAAVAIDGARTRRVRLTPGAAKEVRFALRARRRGTATLTFRVRQGGLTDTLEAPLVVKRPVTPEAAALSGETDRAVRHRLAPLGGLRADHGGLELALASTALIGVEDGLEQLLEYPYGCLEQTASRILPLLASAVLKDRVGAKRPRDAAAKLHAGLMRLLSAQRRDGGFGFWPSSTVSSAWITAYALVVLRRVQQARRVTGVAVPALVLHRALLYLDREADGWLEPGGYGFARQAFLLYALALHGKDVTRRALELASRRRQSPLFARALLLATLASGKRSEEARAALEALTTELGNSLRVEGTTAHAVEGLHGGYQRFMHSDDRTTAMVLHALLKARPRHPMISRLVRWFLVGRKEARFRNTQEAAWALLALWDFAEIHERETPDFEAGLWLGSTRLLKASFRGRSLSPTVRRIPMADLMRAAGRAAQDLTVAKRGRGRLYYLARLRYARLALPRAPRDHGVAVEKTVQVLDHASRPLKAQRPPRLGDTVLVTLRVRSPEARRYLVIDDPLPAGLEALDTSLATTSAQDAEAFGALRSSWYDHRELRDDRVLFFRDSTEGGTLTFHYLARVTAPGRFLAPPTRAEEMYNPEVFGHTASSHWRIDPARP